MSHIPKYPVGTTLLCVGTRHGLFLVSSHDRQRWIVEETRLPASSQTYYSFCDARNQYRLFATYNQEGTHPQFVYSDNFGQSWEAAETGPQFDARDHQQLASLWYIEPGRPEEPGVIYAGGDPASLWMSLDRGQNWHNNTALMTLPERKNWQAIGAGTSVHSIVVDRKQPQRIWLGISEGGCLRTTDGGKSWQACNKNASGQGEISPGIHRLLEHPAQPGILYQQGRDGVYRSTDGGENWVDRHSDLASRFGFPLAADSQHPDTIFTIIGDPQERYNLGDQFSVYRSQDGGDHWETLTRGLPGGPGVRLKVLRHALCTDTHSPCGVYAGTTAGHIFASADRGDTWKKIAEYLPSIYALTVVTIA